VQLFSTPNISPQLWDTSCFNFDGDAFDSNSKTSGRIQFENPYFHCIGRHKLRLFDGDGYIVSGGPKTNFVAALPLFWFRTSRRNIDHGAYLSTFSIDGSGYIRHFNNGAL
jgi:hypothetical protein